MPVKAAKNRKSATLTCEKCGWSEKFPSSSPAAPELTACEVAHKTKGWGYTIGFFSCLAGHEVWCPTCARGEKS